MRALIPAVAILIAVDVPASYRAEMEKYRQDRVAELTAPNGWLAVQGLFWLHDGTNTAGSDPSTEIRLPPRAPKRLGVFTMKDRTVTFTADPAAEVTAGGKPVSSFTFDPTGDEQSAVTSKGITLFVIRRADRVGLRMLDPESAARKAFRGLKYFPLNSKYRVRATFVPYHAPKQVPVPNVLGQLVPMESPGYVEFTVEGKPYRLEPVYERPKPTRRDAFSTRRSHRAASSIWTSIAPTTRPARSRHLPRVPCRSRRTSSSSGSPRESSDIISKELETLLTDRHA
jgi:uncharacterized protein